VEATATEAAQARVELEAHRAEAGDEVDAAHQALRAHGAPLRELDASARDAVVEKALPRLRKWAGETQS